MRVVLDTNVLISALISHRSAPRAIYRAWHTGHFDLITSELQLDEIRRASRYPRVRAVVKPAIVGEMVNTMRRAIVLERLPPADNEADPFDAFLLAMAEAGARTGWSRETSAPGCWNGGAMPGQRS